MAEWTDTSALDALAHELEVHFPTFYGPVIEYGCPPHPVSEEGVRAIRRWAELKPRKTSTKDTMNAHGQMTRTSKRRKLNESEVDDLTNAIVWKIRTRGQEPRPWLRPAIDDAKAQMYTLLKRGIDNGKGAREIADFIITRSQENIDAKGIAYTGKMGQNIRLTDLDTGEILMESRSA